MLELRQARESIAVAVGGAVGEVVRIETVGALPVVGNAVGVSVDRNGKGA